VNLAVLSMVLKIRDSTLLQAGIKKVKVPKIRGRFLALYSTCGNINDEFGAFQAAFLKYFLPEIANK
jgi:hypothetical protein